MSTPISSKLAEADERAEIVFFHALKQPPGEVEDFLSLECGEDAALHAEVTALLRDNERVGNFLTGDSPVTPVLDAEFARLKPEQPGDWIEKYKLLEQLGEGGFGTVWVAEQEKPVRRRVALKIIKLGMDTKEVIARFEQERQALAMMDHPNIARVLDAGATPLGRPFFVMELVRGVKITKYCDQAKLTTAERLRLFIAVCQAVQHAHQKGIIHRDLKPSNILVTLHDGVPVPKVIDFGIAKATQQQRLTDLTIYTQFEKMVGTPLYMSPEQAELSGLDIDTRSDVYSLGVLLYEVLAGRTPFDPETLMKQGLDEIRRAVREEIPPKPSTFVSTMAEDRRTTLAQHRHTDSARLLGQIRGDLDWIVMKALEKDRTRRYDTATSFAQDIQRHLDSEPVQARPPSAGYRFRRFAKRNKTAFAAGGAVAAAILIGLGVATWLYFKEKHARERSFAAEQEQGRLRQLAETQEKKATTEAGKSQRVSQFLQNMLRGVSPSVALGRDTRMLQEILDKTAESIGDDLQDQPEVGADLRCIIGEVYLELGDGGKAAVMIGEALRVRKQLFFNPHAAIADALYLMAMTIADPSKSETMHREALAMRRELLGNGHPDVARSMNAVALLLRVQDKHPESEAMAREALAIARRSLGNDHPDVARVIFTLAQAVGHQGRYVESGDLHSEGLAILRKRYGNEHPDVATTLVNLAQNLRAQHRLAESETLNREALEIARKLYPAGHPAVIDIQENLIGVLADQDKSDEAEAGGRELLAMLKSRFGNEHEVVAAALNQLANVLRDQGELAEAESLFRETLVMLRKLLGNEHPDVADSLNNLAIVLLDQKKVVEAESLFREALVMRRKLLGNEHPDVASSLGGIARVLREQSKLAEAESLFREVLAMLRKLLGHEHPDVATSLYNLAMVLKEHGKLAEAESLFRETLAMRKKLLGNEHPSVANPLHQLAAVLGDQGKLAEAESLFREALAIARESAVGNPQVLEAALLGLAHALYRQDNYAEAEPFYREAIGSRQQRLGAEQNDVLDPTSSLARLLADWAWAECRAESGIQDAKPEAAERARDAERLLRDGLAIRRRGPDAAHWRTTGETPSRLGGALVAVAVTDPALSSDVRLAKLAEAELLLLEGNDVLQQGAKIDRKYKRDALTRLVHLYQAWDKPEKAAEWKQKLADFDKTAVENTTAGEVEPPAK